MPQGQEEMGIIMGGWTVPESGNPRYRQMQETPARPSWTAPKSFFH